MSKPQKDFSHIVSRHYKPNPEWCCEACVFRTPGVRHTCGSAEEALARADAVAGIPVVVRDCVPEGAALLLGPEAIRVGVEFDEAGKLVVKGEVDMRRVTVITGIGPSEKSCNKT